MLTPPTDVDKVQFYIDAIMHSTASVESKLQQLEAIEPIIEDYYAYGLTCVKPVSAMTADDLVF